MSTKVASKPQPPTKAPPASNSKILQTATKNEIEKRNTKQERDQEITTIFNMFDKNGDGQLQNDEIESFLIAIGQSPTPDEVASIIEKLDADKNGYITLDEFINYMDENYVISQNEIDDLIEAFKIFDYNNNGSISKEEFTNILTKYGPNEFSDQDIEDIFEMIDLDHDGTINYAEFIDMWKYK